MSRPQAAQSDPIQDWQGVSLCTRYGNLLAILFLIVYLGKRRYDSKQKGYGGQTKPIFRKKVRLPWFFSDSLSLSFRPKLLRKSCCVLNAPAANTRIK